MIEAKFHRHVNKGTGEMLDLLLYNNEWWQLGSPDEAHIVEAWVYAEPSRTMTLQEVFKENGDDFELVGYEIIDGENLGAAAHAAAEEQLEEAYGIGYPCRINDGDRKHYGDMYGNDECITDDGLLYQYVLLNDCGVVYKCYYAIPEGECDLGNLDYENPIKIEEDSWRWGV